MTREHAERGMRGNMLAIAAILLAFTGNMLVFTGLCCREPMIGQGAGSPADKERIVFTVSCGIRLFCYFSSVLSRP